MDNPTPLYRRTDCPREAQELHLGEGLIGWIVYVRTPAGATCTLAIVPAQPYRSPEDAELLALRIEKDPTDPCNWSHKGIVDRRASFDAGACFDTGGTTDASTTGAAAGKKDLGQRRDVPTFGQFATRAINLMRQYNEFVEAATHFADDVGGGPVEHDMEQTLTKLEAVGRHMGALVWDVDWREQKARALAEYRAEETASPEIPDHLNVVFLDTWDRAEVLRRLVRQNLPEDSEVRQALENCMPAEGVDIEDGDQPTLPALQAALDKFDALSDFEKRRIMNGWTAGSQRDYDRATFLKDLAETSVTAHRVLAIEAGRMADGEPSGDFWLDLDDSIYPVRLFIREGLKKPEALSALAWLTSAIEQHFNRLIADPSNEAGRHEREARWLRQDAAGIPRN